MSTLAEIRTKITANFPTNYHTSEIDNTKIYVSRNLLTGGSTYWYILFGHPVGVTFASQLMKTQSLPNQNTFGTLIRGLEVFGFKGIDATVFGYMVAEKG